MLTPREVALGLANQALSLGRGSVLGADPAEVAAARLDVVRRAQRALRSAIGTPRILLSEADDATLTAALGQIKQMAGDPEARAARSGKAP